MTDFFGSVRNIELMEVNDSTLLEIGALDEQSGQSTFLSTSQSCQSSLPVSPPLAAVR